MDNADILSKIDEGLPEIYRDYKSLVTPSEVPLEFHPFVFMTMVATVVGDQAYFIEGDDRFFPNLWTLLVGESSISRKSTAIRPALKVIDAVAQERILPSEGVCGRVLPVHSPSWRSGAFSPFRIGGIARGT